MLKGQKSVRGGIEDFLCPFTDMYITQAPNGSYSHKGTMAVDVRGKKVGTRYAYYAPCTVKCIKTYPSSGQVMWQSVDRVRCSNGYIGIVTFMTAHDNTMDAKKGLVVPQGNQLGNMGDKAGKDDKKTDGVHCHIEISQSADTTWKKNNYKIYCFNNEVDPEDVWFMDNTNVISGNGKWKYLKDVPVEEPKPVIDEDKVKIEELEKQLEQANKDKDAMHDVIVELESQINSLESRILEQPSLLFSCENDCTIQYKMLKGEELYTK